MVITIFFFYKIVYLSKFKFSGVLWTEAGVIPNAGDGFNALKLGGKKVIFVTNNSVRSPKDYKSKFSDAGVDFNPEEMVHPLTSIIDYLNITKFEGPIYCIANEVFKKAIKDAGFNVIEDVSISGIQYLGKIGLR